MGERERIIERCKLLEGTRDGRISIGARSLSGEDALNGEVGIWVEDEE